MLYLAIEPYARRLNPRFLVSWNRVVQRGRFRDALVGRDILGGVALSTIVILFMAQLPIVLPNALGHGAPPPPMFFPLGGLPLLYFLNAPRPEPLLGGRYVLEALAGSALTAFGVALVFLIVLLGLHLLFRRSWAAIIAYAAVLIAVNPAAEGAGYSAVSIACSLAVLLAWLWGLRFGLVGYLAMTFSLVVWMNLPITATVSAPHFGSGLIGVLTIAGLASYGAITAARRPSPALV